ncbi:MAG TPA: lysoplasmalogenase [Pirellulales bacterium]|nr:lysoplasmalogenase [Pirellulales bacterium]
MMNQGNAQPPDRTRKADGWAFKVATPSRPFLRALWFLWAAPLAFAMIWGNTTAGHSSLPATWGRMGASLTLVAASVAGYAHYRGSCAGRFIALVALGMALGTLGDFFNADLLNNLVPLPDPVLGGMISFGLGHIAYIAACFEAARVLALQNRGKRNMALFAWLVIATIGWYAIVYLAPNEKTRPLVFPALPYSLLLAATAGFATGLAWQCRMFGLMAVGAALFFLSDMLLAIGLFRGSLPHSTEWVWLTYSPGQMLIVFGALAVCPLLAVEGVAPDIAPPQSGDRL